MQPGSFGPRLIKQSERSLAELRSRFVSSEVAIFTVSVNEGSARGSSGASGSDYVKWRETITRVTNRSNRNYP